MSIEEVLFNDIAATLGDRAFPVTICRDGKTCTGTGLTKRELFAAMSMQGIRASAHPLAPTNSADIAKVAIEDADALIAALNPPSGNSIT